MYILSLDIAVAIRLESYPQSWVSISTMPTRQSDSAIGFRCAKESERGSRDSCHVGATTSKTPKERSPMVIEDVVAGSDATGDFRELSVRWFFSKKLRER